MWARTTLRHTLRASAPFLTGTVHVRSSVMLTAALPVASALLSASFSSTAGTPAPELAKCTRWLIHDAQSSAPRECPTPLVLLRTPRLHAAEDSEESFRAWADTFAARGYTAVEVDVSVDPHPGSGAGAAEEVNGHSNGHANGSPFPAFPEPVASAKKALNAQLRLLGIPFAPVLIAAGRAGLVAQAYVSDHAASALVLIDPPADADPRPATEQKDWEWPVFNYEPRFPILLMPVSGSEQAVEASRVGKEAAEGVGRGGQGVSIVGAKDGVRGEGTRMEIERWMDRCGF